MGGASCFFIQRESVFEQSRAAKVTLVRCSFSFQHLIQHIGESTWF
jgi:hypothetical protein